MRTRLFFCLVLPLFGQTPEAKPQVESTEPAFVSGKIFNAATKAPVTRALITLRRTTAANPQQMPPAYTTMTDGEGRFAMKDIPPATYRLSVQRNGYVPTEYGAKKLSNQGTPLTFSAGQRLTALEMALTPHGVIAGRLHDEFGEPVARATVSAIRYGYQYVQGRKQSIAVGSSATNDLGEFRIFGLPPGRYYVVAREASTLSGGTPPEDRSAGAGASEEYVPTFYPRATSMENATQVEAVAGALAQGINMTLAKARPVRVRGRIANETGLTGRISIMLLPRDPMGYPNMMSPAISPNGQFEFRKLVPGRYSVAASINPGGDPGSMASLATHFNLEVGSEDIDNLIIAIRAPADLAGSVVVQGEVKVPLPSLRIALRPAEPVGLTVGMLPSASPNAEGAFVLKNAGTEAHVVTVTGVPATHYVKAIRYGEADALENPLQPAGGAKLEIVIAADPGQVSGTLVDGDRKLVAGATVVLVPDSEKRRKLAQFYRSVVTDQTGAYSFTGVTPGDYRVYAWDDVEQGAWMDPDFMEPFKDAGKKTKLEEGSKETLEIRVIAVPQ